MLIFHSGGHTNTFSHSRAESELLSDAYTISTCVQKLYLQLLQSLLMLNLKLQT